MTADPPDWAALYLQHRDAMYRTACSILHQVGRTDLAEDAVQKAMQSLIEKVPPPDIRNAEALLVTTVKRKAIDIIRAADIKQRARAELCDENLPRDEFEDDVVDTVTRRQDVQRAMAAVATLDEMQQIIIRRVIIEGHTARQVATELGLSPARVSQLQAAALTKLRDLLGRRPS